MSEVDKVKLKIRLLKKQRREFVNSRESEAYFAIGRRIEEAEQTLSAFHKLTEHEDQGQNHQAGATGPENPPPSHD